MVPGSSPWTRRWRGSTTDDLPEWNHDPGLLSWLANL